MSQSFSANAFQRGRKWYFRIRVPVCLVRAGMRREIVFSLGTDSQKVAFTLASAIRLHIDELWATIAEMTDKTKADVERVMRRWFKQKLDEAMRTWISGDLVRRALPGSADIDELRCFGRHAMAEMAEHTIEQMIEERDSHNYSRGYRVARTLLNEFGIDFKDGDRNFIALARYAMRLQGLVEAAKLQWADGNLGYMPELPAVPEGIFPEPSPSLVDIPAVPDNKPVIAAGITISAAFERYVKERKPRPATVLSCRASVRRFIELHGDMDVAQITRRQIATFKDALLQLPTTLKAADHGLSMPALIERYKGKDVKRLSARTINQKHISGIAVALNWCIDNALIENNPCRGVRANGVAQEDTSRLPYSSEDLTAIFSLDVFTKGTRPVGGAGEAAIWLPLLALYTGARLNELGTLMTEDIQKESGIDVIVIRKGKTRNARRKIPIHSELLRHGFLDYVETMRELESAKGRLFPLLTSDSDKPPTGPYGQWWGRIARKVVSDKRKTFHSFRHGVKRALRNANPAGKVLRDAVMGHDTDDTAENYGLDEDGQGYDVAVLAAEIEKIRYPGLTITLAKPLPRTAIRRKHVKPKDERHPLTKSIDSKLHDEG